MKFIIAFLSGLMMIYVSANAQKISADKVPAPVQKSFHAKFPGAANVKWEMEKKDRYEAAFKVNKQELTACFNPEGQWVETETELETSQLPQAVQLTISKDFAGYKIKEAVQTETQEKGKFYEAILV